MDYEICYDWFCWKYGISRQIILIKTSENEGTAAYFNHMNVNGSTWMDENGVIYVTIHDAGGATGSTWYEELMHAKQHIDRGQIAHGLGGISNECEVEVAKCLLDNATKLHLTSDEITLSEKALEYYRQRL